MANDLPGVEPRIEGWETRGVPCSDRGPIAVKTLDLIGKMEDPRGITLSILDQMDLLALVFVGPSDERLRGLCWLHPSQVSDKEALVPLLWVDDFDVIEITAAYQVFRNGIDAWANEHGIERIAYYSHLGYKRARELGKWIGFKVSPLREFVRTVPKEEG